MGTGAGDMRSISSSVSTLSAYTSLLPLRSYVASLLRSMNSSGSCSRFQSLLLAFKTDRLPLRVVVRIFSVGVSCRPSSANWKRTMAEFVSPSRSVHCRGCFDFLGVLGGTGSFSGLSVWELGETGGDSGRQKGSGGRRTLIFLTTHLKIDDPDLAALLHLCAVSKNGFISERSR